MGYLGRRIGKSQNTGTAEGGENGNIGGGMVVTSTLETQAQAT